MNWGDDDRVRSYFGFACGVDRQCKRKHRLDCKNDIPDIQLQLYRTPVPEDDQEQKGDIPVERIGYTKDNWAPDDTATQSLQIAPSLSTNDNLLLILL